MAEDDQPFDLTIDSVNVRIAASGGDSLDGVSQHLWIISRSLDQRERTSLFCMIRL